MGAVCKPHLVYVWVDIVEPNCALSSSCLATSATPIFSNSFISGIQRVEPEAIDLGQGMDKHKTGKRKDTSKSMVNGKVDMGNGKWHGQWQWQERWMLSSSASSWSMGDGEVHGHWQEMQMPSSSAWSWGRGDGEGHEHWQERQMPSSSLCKGHGHGQRTPSPSSPRVGKGKGADMDKGKGNEETEKSFDRFDPSNWHWPDAFVPEYEGRSYTTV